MRYKKGKKSLLINLASGAAEFDCMPFFYIYGPTKKFNDALSQANRRDLG
jgi:hypothetical protein